MTPARMPEPGADHVEMSRAQVGLWFLHRLAPESPAYQGCRAFRVTGPLRLDALRDAWSRVLDRHPILRCTFADVDGRPVARVGAASAYTLVDLSHRAYDEPELARTAGIWCARLAAVAVDLAEGPPARLAVLRFAADEHVVLLVLHRIVADERSMCVVISELSEYYAGGAARRAASSRRRYGEYVRWQRAYLSTADFRDDRAWWTSALPAAGAGLSLPADGVEPADAWWRASTVRFDWDAPLAAALAGLSRVEGTVPFVVLLAAFQALLGRYGGEETVTVGTHVTVDGPGGIGRLIGPCDNLLALVGDLSGNPTFRDVVRRTAAFTAQALRRRALPFVDLVSAANPARDRRRIPLCRAMLLLADDRECVLRVPNAVAVRIPVDPAAAMADLTLSVDRTGPTVTGRLTYRHGACDGPTAALVVDQLRTLLAAALDDPDLPVGSLPLDGPDHPRVAARAADRLAEAVTVTEAVPDLVRGHAATSPRTPAVIGADGAMSYRELDRAAASFAGHLACIGGVAGAPVAVRMAVGARQVAVSLGVLRAGGHVVWFGPGELGERGRMVLTDLDPACLVVDGEVGADEFARWYRDDAGGRVLTAAWPDLPTESDHIGLDRIAYVAYTSGSTGRPKGVAQTHAALSQFVTWMAQDLGIGPDSRVAQWAAPEHDPSLCEVFATLSAGGTLCAVPERIRAHPERFVDWLVDARITFLQTVPSFARELLAVLHRRGRPGQLAALDRLVLMGEALPGGLANGLREALPGTRLANVYGPTETIAATWHDVDHYEPGSVAIGRPIAGRQVLVLDELDRPCPTGVTGQIVIRSPYVASGYLGVDPAAAPAFRPVAGPRDQDRPGVGTYRTGDLGRWRPDGRLEFRGRRDLQVKLLGTRVELAEVEAELAAHESVAECAVVALADTDGLVHRLVAYVVAHPLAGLVEGDVMPPGGVIASAAVWRAHLRRRFGTAMVLVSFVPMTGRLPRNVGGKVDRHRLPDPRLAGSPPVARTPGQDALAGVWSDVLGGRDGGRDGGPGRLRGEETFFDVGGSSVLVPVLAHRIREILGVEVPLAELYVSSSLAEMSTVVESARAASANR